MTRCKRCGIGEGVRDEDCLGCQLVLAKDRILEIERKCVVETFTLASDLRTARAQVETLAGALRWYAKDDAYKEHAFKEDGVFKSMTPTLKDAGDRARAALKAAGVET